MIEAWAGRHNILHRLIKTGLDMLFSQNQFFKYKINFQRITCRLVIKQIPYWDAKTNEPNLTFLQNSSKVLHIYIVTNILFVKIIFLSVPYIHYKLMKLNFATCVVFSLISWRQHPSGKIGSLRCQNGVIASDSFAFRKTKSCRNILS